MKKVFMGLCMLACAFLLFFAGAISQWTLFSGTIADDDLFAVTDVSDTTQGENGTSKRLPWSVFKAFLDTIYQATDSTLDAISNTEAFTQNRLRETVHTAEPTDEVAGDRIIADNDTWDPCSIDGTDDYEVICLVAGSPGTWKAIRNMVTGEILSASIDLTGGSIAASYTISSPQSLSVTTEDDVTVGTELTSSVVLLTGDNDTDNDTLTLQDGITDGTILTFFMAAGVDTDDNIIIDAETDSTCTGCPDSGIFTFTANGGSLTLWWSGSAWFFRGQVNGE